VGLSLADMRAAVVRNLGGSMTAEYDIAMPNPLLTSIVNECLATIDSEADWPWNQQVGTLITVAGTHLYTPTAGWVRTDVLTHPDHGPLGFVSLEELARRWGDVTEQGTFPLWYSEAGGQLDLRPTPSTAATLVHVYYATEPELIDDGDEPLLPDRFRPRLIHMATAEVASRNANWALQQRHQNMDPDYKKRMDDERRRVKATAGIGVRPGTWDS
jgi:hypothetical protein